MTEIFATTTVADYNLELGGTIVTEPGGERSGIEHVIRPWGVGHALWAGFWGVASTLLVTIAISILLTVADLRDPSPVIQPWHWLNLYPDIYRLAVSGALFPKGSGISDDDLKTVLEFIYTISVLLSVFSQYLVTDFFVHNELYKTTVLRISLPLPWYRSGFTVVHVRVLTLDSAAVVENFLIKGALALFAASSILFVEDFRYHMITAVLYLGLIFLLDFVYFLMVGDGPSIYRYRGIPAGDLFREFNRQLVLRIDLIGLVALGITPLGVFVLNLPEKNIREMIFFTGIISFYLVSTVVIIFDLLSSWNGILQRKSIIDRSAAAVL